MWLNCLVDVALRKAILEFVCFHFNYNKTEVCQFKDILGLFELSRVIRKNGDMKSSLTRRGGCHLSDDILEAELTPVEISSAGDGV